MDCFQILNPRQFQRKGWYSPRNQGFRSGGNRRTHPARFESSRLLSRLPLRRRRWRGLGRDVVSATTDRIGMADEGAQSDAYLQLPDGSCRCSECSTHRRVAPILRSTANGRHLARRWRGIGRGSVTESADESKNVVGRISRRQST
jgi:hypothetical protein